MENENRKLIYELSKIARSSETSEGLIYYKEALCEDSESRKIWAKRAYKKGYCDLMREADSYYLFRINNRGLELLSKFSDYYLLHPKKIYNEKELTIKERRELRRKQRENLI